MQRPRLSAVEAVPAPYQPQPQQSAPFTGLCDCLKQPRRVRPEPTLSDEYNFIETRPRRRIRVVHLVPVRRVKPPVVTTNLPPSDLTQYTSSIFIDSRLDTQQRNYDHFQKRSVVEKLDDFPDDYRPGIPDYYGDDDLVVGNGSSHLADPDEEDPDEEDLSDFEEFPSAATSTSPPLPVYGFESPYHPKNVAETAERLAFKLRIFADRLVHVILDEAFLEYSALRELLVLPDQHRNGEVTYDIRRRWTSGEDGRLSGLPCDCGNSTRLHPAAWDNSDGRTTSCGHCHPATNESMTNGWDETVKLRPAHHHLFHYDNPTFRTSLLGLDGSNVRGESMLEQAQRVASFRISRSRSSARLRNLGLANGQRSSLVSGTDDMDAPPDPLSKFTYHPTGDDTTSQPESSSFPSSTWGSSTDSSVRYVRRFLSRKFKTKPLLFFVHGAGDSADLWRAQLEFFRERGYETLAMDLIGHGMSCAPNEPKAYAFHVILTDVVVLFDRYSRERNVVVGHSYGACFAAALARHRPKLVTHLILLSGGGPFPLCPQPPKVHLPMCLTSCVRSLLSCGTKRETFYVPSRKQARVVKNLDIPSYVLKYIRQGQVWLEGDASFHKQIIIPTLLIYGLRDPYVTLVEECEMEKTIPRAFLELIPEASHMIMLDAPNQVNDMIYKFLRRWDR